MQYGPMLKVSYLLVLPLHAATLPMQLVPNAGGHLVESRFLCQLGPAGPSWPAWPAWGHWAKFARFARFVKLCQLGLVCPASNGAHSHHHGAPGHTKPQWVKNKTGRSWPTGQSWPSLPGWATGQHLAKLAKLASLDKLGQVCKGFVPLYMETASYT